MKRFSLDTDVLRIGRSVNRRSQKSSSFGDYISYPRELHAQALDHKPLSAPILRSLEMTAQYSICTKRSCDIVFIKMKVIWFCLRKTISGSYLQQNNSDLVFQTRTMSKKEEVRSWSRDQTVIFKIKNYLFLSTNFALKLQGKCWKDDVVTFKAHLSVTIKRLPRYNQKVVLAGMLEGKSMPSSMAANTNHTTLLKNQSAIKYLASMHFHSNFGCKIIFMGSVNFWHQQDSNTLFKESIGHVTS